MGFQSEFFMDRVFLVASGMLNAKKWNNKFAKKHYYLNYGLLSIATKMKSIGYNPIQVHGNFTEPEDTLSHLFHLGLEKTAYPLFLSITSFFAVPWAKRFSKTLKTQLPEIKLVVGGRWVVKNREQWIANEIPQVDLIVSGLAEGIIKNLFEKETYNCGEHPAILEIPYSNSSESLPIDCLDYSLLDESEKYPPSIEISRGCGMGCAYCEERAFKLTSIKSPELISKQYKHLCDIYKTNTLTPYFEASFFRPRKDWALELINVRKHYSETYQWRCESRADMFYDELTSLLVRGGFKVIDLGLESASPTQLLRMNKTRNPKRYLDKASGFIKFAASLGVWIKVNILLFFGESTNSISETMEWLDKHRDYIKGVSVGPIIAFGQEQEANTFLDAYRDTGASIARTETDICGVSRLNLSKEIDYSRSSELALEISREFMTQKDYFDLKSFSYLPRDYTYNDFCHDLKDYDNDLPFKV